ncbi:dihydroxyacetone kinase subunit DhaL [Klebsiella sp. WOUb02]|uniref:dihydroxyacetone kinase subunit DhaL n=1 Tax=Klebsiella sp. WOUb02 TaxID=3161071 RepID=UPI003CEFC79E
MSFTNKDGLAIAKNMIAVIQQNKTWLSEIDGAAGDGDHGINMNKGFTLAGQALTPAMAMTEAFQIIGETLLNDIGGSMGPLYGCWFAGLSRAGTAEEVIDAAVLGRMFTGALADLRELTPAGPGDKTLLDVLIPATDALGAALASGEGEIRALESMRQTAEDSFTATSGLVSRVGRASRLGERSRGCPDAGAGSSMLLLKAFADAAILLIKQGER